MRLHEDEPSSAAVEFSDNLSISQMSRSYNVSLRTLRFYEARGLLSPQREQYARRYDAASRARLELILKGKQLGFTLSEIRDMIASESGDGGELSLAPAQIVAQIGMLQRQRTGIDQAILELEATHARLAQAGQGARLSEEPRRLERVG